MLTLADVGAEPLADLLKNYGLTLAMCADGAAIPGTFWGEPEAGLVQNKVFARPDTPVHSILHESCHAVCMPPERRSQLDTDAGGSDSEECAVCYLQVLLGGQLDGVGRERLLRDMDAWGYSFRLDSAARWFAEDAQDARDWLLERGIIDASDRPTWRLNEGRGV